jgi:hypothetical protein
MFQVEICSQQLEICKSMCMFLEHIICCEQVICNELYNSTMTNIGSRLLQYINFKLILVSQKYTLTKLVMHVSSRNMFPTTRNLQIHVHVYRPRHCCGDWLIFDCFVPMIWTLSGRLSLMRTVQLMKKKNIYILCVSHKNNCKKQFVHTTWNRQIHLHYCQDDRIICCQIFCCYAVDFN